MKTSSLIEYKTNLLIKYNFTNEYRYKQSHLLFLLDTQQ